MYFVLISVVYLSYDFTLAGWIGTQAWLAGYKVMLLLASVKSVLQMTREAQCSALVTTSKSEILALYREETLLERGTLELCCGKDDQREPRDRQGASPVFWCCFVTVLVSYNMIHLAMAPLSDVDPLVFGAPIYALLFAQHASTQGPWWYVLIY